MNAPDFPNREQRLNEILLNYVEAVQQGHAPDRRLLLALYPEFAPDLTDFFAGRDQMEALAVPLRQESRAGTFRLAGSNLLSESTQDFVELPSPAPWRPGLGREVPEGTRVTASEAGGEPELGQLGDFQLLREIGRGGMGIVYEARQISLNRRVALKVLPFAAAFDPKQLQRFKNEAQAAAQLQHANIVPVYFVGEERGVHYYAMQFIEGRSLSAMIRELQEMTAATAPPAPEPAVPRSEEGIQKAPASLLGKGARGLGAGHSELQKAATEISTGAAEIPTERSAHTRRFYRRAAELGKIAATALENAHQQGVIHRDIKPANLLVDLRGNLWITDFGLALFQSEGGITLTGEVLGTLRYMSPEQALGKRSLIDRRTDIYSLGVTLYELLTLEPVFDGQDRQELLQQIAHDEPRPPRSVQRAIPVELETIILKAIAKNPSERYGTAQELADDLQRFLEDKPILARRPTMWDKAMKWSRRHRPVVGSAAALLVLTTIGLMFAVWFVAREHRETVKAYEREQTQRQLAEDSFRQARRALDFLTQISDEKLADKPGLQTDRRELLQAALEYYQDFIEQRGDDPSLQADVAASYARIANILSELGHKGDALAATEKARKMLENLIREHPDVQEFQIALASISHEAWALQGLGQFLLLFHREVQEKLFDELQLSDDQIQQIMTLSDELKKQRPEPREFGKPTKEQLQQKKAEWRKQSEANAKALAAILTPDQANRLKQITWQLGGADSFGDPEVIVKLQLTGVQLDQIRTIQNQARKVGWQTMRACHDWNMAEKKNKELWELSRAKVMELLADDQKNRWQEMIGKPFQVELHFPPPPWFIHHAGKHPVERTREGPGGNRNW
jgi:serine/threonine protein kinase